jgi:hypothetical protein
MSANTQGASPNWWKAPLFISGFGFGYRLPDRLGGGRFILLTKRMGMRLYPPGRECRRPENLHRLRYDDLQRRLRPPGVHRITILPTYQDQNEKNFFR